MDTKTTCVLEDVLRKSERTLRQMVDHPKHDEFEHELQTLRCTLERYASEPPSISDALGTARQILDLRETVQRAAVYADLERLYRRDRAKALALFAVRMSPARKVG